MTALTSTEKPLAKHARLTRDLREKIVRGKLRPGDRLPSFAELRAQHGIALSTIEKVLSALEKEELVERRPGSGTYVKQPRHHLTGNIGLIGSAAFQTQRSPYFTYIKAGVQEAALRHHQDVLLLATDRDWNASLFEAVDGVLLSGHKSTTNQEIARAKPPHMPCVSMLVAAEGMTSVVMDDYGGSKLAVRHLHQLGHRRIACLMQAKTRHEQILRDRYAGYCDALKETDIAFDARRVRLDEKDRKDRRQSFLEWGREQMRDWLQSDWRELGCTAILVQNDEAAIGVMQVLRGEKIDVPGEVSVIGFDGTEICDHATPRLASVQLPLEQMGAKAVELLAEQIKKGRAEEQLIVLPAKLREGDSIAPV